jgi:hypothetical protein
LFEGWSRGGDDALEGGRDEPPHGIAVSGILAPSTRDASLSDPWRGCEELDRLMTPPGILEGIGEAVLLAKVSEDTVSCWFGC